MARTTRSMKPSTKPLPKISMQKASKASILRIFERYREIGAALALIAITLIFGYTSEGAIYQPHVWGDILTLGTERGIIAIGEAFLMISGEFDLSVGSVFAASRMLAAWLLNQGYNFYAVLGIILAMAIGIGLVNAVITIRLGVLSFITTLGMMWFLRGLIFTLSGGFPIGLEVSVPEIDFIGMSIGGTPITVMALILVALMLILHIVLSCTRYGNWVQAVGGAPTTARALGINVPLVKTINFVLCSVFAALSGIISLALIPTAFPTDGMGYELEAIAASVIGGTSLTGGIGTIVGAFLGAIMISEIRVGLVLSGAPGYLYIGFLGLFLIIVAAIQIRATRRRE